MIYNIFRHIVSNLELRADALYIFLVTYLIVTLTFPMSLQLTRFLFIHLQK